MRWTTDFDVLTWVVRSLYAGAAVAYAAHLWLVWSRFRQARWLAFGPPGPRRRRRVSVTAEVLVHEGEGFLLRDLLPAPDEP